MLNNKVFVRHYERAKNVWRGYTLVDCDKYEMHVRKAHAFLVRHGLLEDSDVRVKNTIRMYKEL